MRPGGPIAAVHHDIDRMHIHGLSDMSKTTRSMYLAYTSRSPGCGRKHPSTLPAVRPDAIGWAADAFPELEIRRSISCMIDCARRE